MKIGGQILGEGLVGKMYNPTAIDARHDIQPVGCNALRDQPCPDVLSEYLGWIKCDDSVHEFILNKTYAGSYQPAWIATVGLFLHQPHEIIQGCAPPRPLS
jgi:hypothetical protein